MEVIKSPVDKLLDKASNQKKQLLDNIKRNGKITEEKIVDALANIEISDDEEEGRSVTQEVDYSN